MERSQTVRKTLKIEQRRGEKNHKHIKIECYKQLNGNDEGKLNMKKESTAVFNE